MNLIALQNVGDQKESLDFTNQHTKITNRKKCDEKNQIAGHFCKKCTEMVESG